MAKVNYRKGLNFIGAIKFHHILIVLAIVFAIFFGSKIMKWLNKLFGDPEAEKQKKKNQEDRIKQIKAGLPASIKAAFSTYQRIADQAYEAMIGVGTDGGLLYSLFKPLNSAQLRAVYCAFGVKENTVLGVGTIDGDIFDWFEDELSKIPQYVFYGPSQYSVIKEVWLKSGVWPGVDAEEYTSQSISNFTNWINSN